MPNINNIATSSLSAYRTALETVANNIANVNTEGFARQTVDFSTRGAQNVGSGYIGNGVAIKDITRKTSEFNTRIMQDSFADYNYYKAFYDRAVVIDNLFSREGTDLSQNIQAFFNALEQANEAPDSLPARNVVMEQSRFLADQFQTLHNIVDESRANLRQQVLDVTSNMSSIAENIADINKAIIAGGRSPNLLDERDQLVLELAEFTDVQTSLQPSGAMDVHIGRGEALVVGPFPSVITSSIDPDNGSTIINSTTKGVTFDITLNVIGGSLQALLDHENKVLRETDRQLGIIAMAFSEQFNNQNKLGMDFNGNIGQNFFTDFNDINLQSDRSIANPSNSNPNADVNVFIADVSQVQNSDYFLYMTSPTTATLTRESDNTTTNLTFAAGVATTIVDGFELRLTAPLVAGDRFSIGPSRDMAGEMRLLQESPSALALAGPVRTFSNANNLRGGSINIENVSTTDQTGTNAPDLTDNFEIRILALNPAASPGSDFEYELVNTTDGVTLGGAGATFYGNFDTAIAMRNNAAHTGYDVSITGPVRVGDVYHSEFNTSGVADNSNGRKLANINQQTLINNGTETILDRYSHMIANLGTETYYAKIRQESSDVLFRQAESQKLAEVGVNLDEEAANLVSLQQAYQASGQLIRANKEMMDIVFSLLA